MAYSEKIAFFEIAHALTRAKTADYYGEPVSQLEHALQTAALAAASGSDEELQIAALLHDIGHLIADAGYGGCQPLSLRPDVQRMDAFGAVDHELIGAKFLEDRGFSGRIVQLVGGHVAAKRYLAARTARYLERLSAASLETLRWQGGPMSDAESAQFDLDPLRDEKLRLRAWDEAAKVQGAVVAPIEHYSEMIERHLNRSKSENEGGI